MRPYKNVAFGTGNQRAGTVGSILSLSTTQFSVVDGTAVAAHTHTLKAGSLYKNGQGVKVVAWGTFAADGDAGTLNLRFGGLTGTVIATIAKTNDGNWYAEALVFRTAASVQKSVGFGHNDNAAPSTITVAAPTEDETADISIVVEIDATNADDVVVEGSYVQGFENPS